MAKQVTLTLPDSVYLHAQELATIRQQNIQAILVYQLIQAMTTSDGNQPEPLALSMTPSVSYEKDAYRSLHPQLWKQYPRQHVAIYHGQLVDHDEDGIALSRRVYAQYPEEFVLIKKVESQPERTLHFRSPRFMRKGSAI